MNKSVNKNNKLISIFMGGMPVDWFREEVILFPYEHQKHLGLPKIINI